MKKVGYILLLSILLVGVGGWYLVKEADAAGPGDLLYPVDTAAEAISRLVTFDDLASAELEQEILEERVEELELLVEEESIDEELVLGATEKVSAQRARVQEHIEDGEATQEGAMETVRNRYEIQAEEQIQVMEKVQTKVEGAEAKSQVQQVEKDFSDSLNKGNSGTSGNDSSTGNGR